MTKAITSRVATADLAQPAYVVEARCGHFGDVLFHAQLAVQVKPEVANDS